MSRNLLIILLILTAVALSGCTGTSNTPNATSVQVQKFSHENPNLDAQMVDVKFDRDDTRAGEPVWATLYIANTGTEKITNETVDIKAKVITLNDAIANLYLKIMSEEKKTRAVPPINFNTEIEPGTVKTVSALFHTIKEMEGRNLAGTYEITVTLSVNGQKVESRTLPITLYSGEPRNFTPTPTPTPSPTPALPPTPTQTPTPEIIYTEVPTPTPVPVVVATPTGKIRYTRVKHDQFVEPYIQINAGDEVLWDNYDVLTSFTYTIVEEDGKIGTITLPEAKKANYTFTTTGEYKFALYYQNMRGNEPSRQTINVVANASQ